MAGPRRARQTRPNGPQRDAIPNDRSLKQELATPIYWFDSAGRKVVEPKAEIKKRLLGAGSPDIADALALTFAAPVAPRRTLEDDWMLRRHRRPRREYDPFEQMDRELRNN